MKLSYHGQSCFMITTESNFKILIDPYISGNPLSDLNAHSINADIIVVTHGHTDHVGDSVLISKRLNIPIVCMIELASLLKQEGALTHAINLGGTVRFGEIHLKFVTALHSSSYKGNYAGPSTGVIIDDGFHYIYHAGDTALYSDMSLYKNIDIALLPIGDRYTMGIEDACLAASLINPKLTIPMHYAPNSHIDTDPYQFVEKLNTKGKVLKIGEIYEL